MRSGGGREFMLLMLTLIFTFILFYLNQNLLCSHRCFWPAFEFQRAYFEGATGSGALAVVEREQCFAAKTKTVRVAAL
jgi:hypothetical protein